MRIAITGALGHIGSRLIRDIPTRFPNADVLLVNHYAAQRYYPLFDLPGLARYHFHGLDVQDADLESLFSGADAVIHLASVTRTGGGPPLSDAVERLNLRATERVARACAQVGAALVHLSTTSVYGSRRAQLDETCPTEELIPQSPYAQAKLREENWLRNLAPQLGLRFVIGRFGTTFGFSPGMRFDTAVNKFCWQANLGQPLTVWETALDQQRPYLDVADASSALLFFLEHKLFDGQVYNVLSLNTTVRQILELIRRQIPSVQVELVRDSRMNDFSFEVSNARLRRAGLEFRGDLERGIREVLMRLRAVRAVSAPQSPAMTLETLAQPFLKRRAG